MAIDGSGLTPILQEWAGDIVIDSRSDRLYWVDVSGVHSSDLGGVTQTTLFAPQVYSRFRSLAVDDVQNQIYFVEDVSSTIYRMSFDGSNPVVVVPSDGLPDYFTRIECVRVDANARKLYWSYNPSLQEHLFVRSNLDGTQRETLFASTKPIQDFEIDSLHEKIYWTSSGFAPNTGQVNRANLDGSQRETLISGNLWGVYGLALDVNAGKIYFTDTWTYGPLNYDGTVRVANLDGSMMQTILNTGPMGSPGSLAIDNQIVPEPSAAVSLFMVGLCSTAFLRPSPAARGRLKIC